MTLNALADLEDPPPPSPRLGGPQSVRMRENQGKMRTRITPNTDSFYAAHFSKKTETGK